MKVLHILNELKFSGAEIMLKAAKSKFKEHSIETTVLSTGSIIGEFSEELQKCEYTIKHIPFHKSFNFVFKVYTLLKNNSFDVVHIHSERFFFFYIIIAKLAGVNKIVRTIHSTFIFKGWLSFRRKMMLQLGSFLECTYISISKNVQENEYTLNHISSILINNWIDTNYFKPSISHHSQPLSATLQLNLISVGTCSHVKQHFYILELVSILKNRGYSVNYLHLGSGELEENEKVMAENLNINGIVHFLGNQTNVLQYLHQCDFFLMPSAYEGLGNSCVEAMATGIIPIVNDAPGLRDLVNHELNGLVVDFKNIESVATIIINLLHNENRKEFFRNNARQKVIELYSLANVEKQIDVYVA